MCIIVVFFVVMPLTGPQTISLGIHLALVPQANSSGVLTARSLTDCMVAKLAYILLFLAADSLPCLYSKIFKHTS
jgi:hypothetical protein